MVETAAQDVDGLRPKEFIAAENAEQIAALLKQASEEQRAIAPVGGGTMLDLGGPLARADVAISTSGLNKVLDYQPANLTVRAEAGITLAALNQVLAENGQFLPLDPFCPTRATLGGILAANASGPLRARYGSARDLLIGIRVALADGQIVHGGGQVVKNVAGYDLPKLFVGSLGTLGIIVESTFKVAPLPSKSASFVGSFGQIEQVARVAQRLAQSPLIPSGIEVLNPTAAGRLGFDSAYTLAVRFGGIESAVRRELNDTVAWSREADATRAEVLEDDKGLWGRLLDIVFEEPIVLRIGLLPTQITETESIVANAAEAHGLDYLSITHGVGVSFVGLDTVSARSEEMITELRQKTAERGGHLSIIRAPRALRERVDAWGPPEASWTLMGRLKQELDPHGILNPGRFPW